MTKEPTTARRTAFLVLLMLTAATVGCIGNSDGEEVEQTGAEPRTNESSNRTAPSGPVQESSGSWATGEACGGLSPTNVQTTDGVNHDVIQLDPAAPGQPFNATITSEMAPVTWSVIFYGGFPPQPRESYESTADEIEGDVPDESDWFAVVTSCGGLNHEAQFTVLGGAD